MRKKKLKRTIRRFKYLKEARKNILFNFRNNCKIKGCYLTMKYVYSVPVGLGYKREECLVLPIKYKNKFVIGDVVFFNQRMKLDYTIPFKAVDCRKKEKLYFTIIFVEEQEIWDGIMGPYFVVFLSIIKLNNLEFLFAMNDLKNRKKGRKNDL